MTHELDTRLNRRVCHVRYTPADDWDDDDELLALENELEAEEDWKPNCFVRFVERFPYIVLIVILALAVGCGVLLYYKAPVPGFINGDDPTEGFETRGTTIHKREWTLNNLYQHRNVDYFLQPNVTLVLHDFVPPGMEGIAEQMLGIHGDKDDPESRQKRSTDNMTEENIPEVSGSSNEPWDKNKSACPPISFVREMYSFKFVIKSRDSQDLLSLENLQAQCVLEEQVLGPYVQGLWALISLPRLVLCLRNKSYDEPGCTSLTQQDVIHFRFLLGTCAPFFYNTTLSGDSKSLPPLCHEHKTELQHFFAYMAPDGYYDPKNTTGTSHKLDLALTYISEFNMLLPDSRRLYDAAIEGKKIKNDNVGIVAMSAPQQLDLKSDLFADYLLEDLQKYFPLALGLILVIMVFYTKSLAIMVATVLNVGISFIFACVIYFFVCRMHFFPFINLLAGLVLIAVGADDVFIFYDTWKQIRSEHPGLTYAQCLSRTYSHAALSIFVTSFTTASAFFTNVISSTITCIRCFGIFAGIAILINFVVMVTWTPAAVMCIEKLWDCFLNRITPSCKSCMECLTRCFSNKTSPLSEAVFAKCFPKVIGKAWFVWIVALLGLGVGGAIVVFVKPRLQLPRSKDFQLFQESNVLENWDLHYTQAFPYQISGTEQEKIPLHVLFGFQARDGGDWLDPENTGHAIIEDPAFSITENDTQLWLTEFCNKLKNQSFVDFHYQTLPCSFEEYGQIFKDKCDHPESLAMIPLGPCCRAFKPPYDPEQLEKCVPAMQVMTGGQIRMMGTPIYDANNTIRGFLFSVLTNLNFTMSYDEMNKNYQTLEKFFDKEIANSPRGMRTGFFTSQYRLTFYDLQGAIANGTYMSILLSLAIAFGIMLLTSMNLLITFYAIITIAGAIIGTVASIVLMGWDLNIIESITISLAVGLSIDFTIHYGVAYRLSRADKSLPRTSESFERVGSAVAMAALTTFAAGIAMMPSRVIAYTKLGTFLMLVMAFSWVYSTFFFQSVCRIIGPRGRFCQISFSMCRRKCNKSEGTESSSQLIFRDDAEDDDDDDALITF